MAFLESGPKVISQDPSKTLVAREKTWAKRGPEKGALAHSSCNRISPDRCYLSVNRNYWPKTVKGEFWDLVRWLNKDARERECSIEGVSPWALKDAERAIRETYSTGVPALDTGKSRTHIDDMETQEER